MNPTNIGGSSGIEANRKPRQKLIEGDMAQNNDAERNADINGILQADNMTVAQLREELKKRKLKIAGNKDDLITRLKAALILEDQQDESSEDDVSNDESNDERGNSHNGAEEDEARGRTRFVPTFKDVEESIDTFSGDDGKNIKSWIKEFEDLAKLCEWNAVQRTIYAKRLLRGSARLFMKTDECGKTWKTMKVALEQEFALKVDSRAVHKELQRRKKRADESYHEYCYKMMEIAARADVETRAIIRYIIDGVDDEGYRKSVLYGAKNIRELKDKFDVYMEMCGKSKSKTYENKRKPVTNAEKKEMKRCYNCGDNSHLSAACPSKGQGVKCFACNKYGHIASKCPESAGVEKKKSCNVVQYDSGKCYKDVVINNTKLSAIVDSGSDISLISEEQYKRIGSPTLSNRTIRFRGAGPGEIVTLGDMQLKIGIDAEIYDFTAHLVRDGTLPHGILIGSDFLNTVEVRIKKGVVSVSKIVEDITEVPEVFKIDIIRDDKLKLSHIKDEEIRKEVEQLVGNYEPKKEKETGIKMSIVVKDDIPVTLSARRLSVAEKTEVDSQVRVWLNEGIIQPSCSDYASPIVLVRKKDGGIRICVDYRKLNEKIMKNRYPLPLIEDQLDLLQGAKIYSTLDLKNGFFHVSIEEDSRKYTAFVVPNGHYEFLKMPFGLCTSPAYFQKYINAVFRDLAKEGIVAIYMDDLIVPSLDVQSGLTRLKMVLKTAAEHGLLVNWKKCQLLDSKVNYLGHLIEDGKVSPAEEKTDAIKHFPKPTNVRSVQSFLGLTGFYRKYIPRYSYLARPLTELLKKGVEFKFGKEQEHAFDQLKEALSSRPVLHLYCPTAETELHTDASALGFGAILVQRDSEDRMFHPVYYASGKTTPAESKYDSYKLEVLAIVKALKKFRVYLIGISFTIVTDCKAFTQTMKKKDICAQVARWAFFLEDFRYAIIHRPGNNMRHVDALSRYPLPTSMIIEECDDSIRARLRRNQLEDEELKSIRKQVEKQETDEFVIINGLLCKRNNDDTPIVVPKLMQTSVIRHVHERGHFGAAKTEQLLKSDYWMKNMHSRVDKIIRNCLTCIMAMRKTGKREGWLHQINKEVPLDTYHIDHLGPMPSTQKKYQYILAVIDAFTKFVWLYPTKGTTTTEVLDHLMKQSAVWGNPRRIVSDQGTAFTSRDFGSYCEDEGIEHITIVTGIPRGNGQIERLNRTLISLLTKLSIPHPTQWYKFVTRAQQYLNQVPSRSTGKTPFDLLFGTRMRLKEDPQIKEILEAEGVNFFQGKRDQIREEARQAISRIQAENKQTYNRKRKKPNNYGEGDLVAIQRTQSGPGLKLCAKYLGPYQVKRILRNDRYIVVKIGQGEGPKQTSTAADHMKPWAD